MNYNTCTIGTFTKMLIKINSLFDNKSLFDKYIKSANGNIDLPLIHKEFNGFLKSKRIVTKKEHSKTCNVHLIDIPFNHVVEYKKSCFIDYDKANNDYMLTLYNSGDTGKNLFKLEVILFMEFYLEEILNFYDADDDNIKNKCFCDYCGDFVYTAECESVEIADAEKNYFEVACNKCYIELYKKES